MCYFCTPQKYGEVSEWSKEHAWKVCIRQKCIEGSNPSLSADSKNQSKNKLIISDLDEISKSLLFGKGQNKDKSLFLTMKSTKFAPFKEPEVVEPSPTATDNRIHVRYYYFNEKTNKYKRFRVYDIINQQKTYAKKIKHAQDVAKGLLYLLTEKDYNPFDETSKQRIRNESIIITYPEAMDIVLEYLTSTKDSRKKTLQSYKSKLGFFKTWLNANNLADIKITDVKKKHVMDFLSEYKNKKKWVNRTYNTALEFIGIFFNHCIRMEYLTDNPTKGIEKLKVEDSESHAPYSDADLKKLMEYLLVNDYFLYLYCSFIFYTCIRPRESRFIEIRDIDLVNRTITVRAQIAKNRKTQHVRIDEQLYELLSKLNLSTYDKNDFLFSNAKTIIGKTSAGETTIRNRFDDAIEKTKLQGNHYSIYGFKHSSNVQLFKKAGWSLSMIMQRNRHASLVEVETYLRSIMKNIEIDDITKPRPGIMD